MPSSTCVHVREPHIGQFLNQFCYRSLKSPPYHCIPLAGNPIKSVHQYVEPDIVSISCWMIHCSRLFLPATDCRWDTVSASRVFLCDWCGGHLPGCWRMRRSEECRRNVYWKNENDFFYLIVLSLTKNSWALKNTLLPAAYLLFRI